MKSNNNKFLLHACCAICSGYPILHLRELGYEPIVYFCNPNISPESEYEKRLEAQIELCKNLDCELIVDKYEPKLFEIAAFGFEDEPERGLRCKKCFELRLNITAKKAKELGIENFTTSITISPHKDFKLISGIGKKLSKKYGINYLEIDFKKRNGTLQTNKISRDLGLYRQDYCGCKFSERKGI